MKYRERKEKLKISFYILLGTLLIMAAVFGAYVSDYYQAEPEAVAILQQNSFVTQENGYIALRPSAETEIGFLFYPGAKVEYTAYLPILEKLRENGILCVLVEMPFNMAIFKENASDSIYQDFPEITKWYIGGHSMGGAMASSYAAKHQDKIQGVILLGAYIYGEYPPQKALTIYGSLNTSVGEKVDYTENVVVIEGGNHAQFGNYGKQKGDQDADISTEEQQRQAVEAITEFMNCKNGEAQTKETFLFDFK